MMCRSSERPLQDLSRAYRHLFERLASEAINVVEFGDEGTQLTRTRYQ